MAKVGPCSEKPKVNPWAQQMLAKSNEKLFNIYLLCLVSPTFASFDYTNSYAW
jgi:hypothetical protein